MKSRITLLVSVMLALVFTGCENPDEDTIVLKSITISPSPVNLAVGGKQQLTATLNPENAPATLEWSSETPAIATVSTTGEVTARTKGTTKVIVKSGSVKAEVEVTVYEEAIALTDITVAPTLLELKYGGSRQLTATLVPENATGITVTYETTNAAIATVSDAGLVTATGVGSAVIKVKGGEGDGKVEKEVPVTVGIKDFSITPETKSINIGETWQLVMTTDPAGADADYTFESGDTSIATVDEDGVVTAVDTGSATITVKSGDIEKTATVTVNDPAKALWTATTSSHHDNMGPANLIDGDPATCWHGAVPGPWPAWAIIDFGKEETVHGVRFWQRQGGPDDINMSPRNMTFSVGKGESADAATWELLVQVNDFTEQKGDVRNLMQSIYADVAKTGRFLKVEVTFRWGFDQQYTYIGELDIMRNSNKTVTTVPLEFDDPAVEANIKNMTVTKNGDGSVTLNVEENTDLQEDEDAQAYVYFKTANFDLTNAAYVGLRMTYKYTKDGEDWGMDPRWRYFKSGAETYASPEYGVLLPRAEDWTVFQTVVIDNLHPDIIPKTGNPRQSFDRLRLDLPAGVGRTIEVKDVEIVIFN